jgi:colanic acid biosynthesis glycosyl transferase WcaI
MKILVASINFAPDHSGIGVYSTDFPLFLAERGDDVTMVTGFSYYPAWKKRPEDQWKFFETEIWNQVRVLRGWLYVPGRVSTLKRLLHEASFCFFAFLNFARAGRQDAIVVFSPPFLLVWVGKLYSVLWNCPLVVNVQDLPLDAATSLGMVRHGWFTMLVSTLERWLYRSADLVASISRGMLESLRNKGVSSDKLALVPNWIDTKAESGIAKGAFRSRHPQSEGRFLVAYAGNLGVKQGVESLLRLAKNMEQDSRFLFFLIGDGADKPRLLRISRERKLLNTVFLPLLDPRSYREMLEDVDLIFVGQRHGAGNNFFPSKLLGLMAQGKPLLVAADSDSELAQSVAKWQCGMVSCSEDIPSMARHLDRVARDSNLCHSLGFNARREVGAYDRGKVLGEWRERIFHLAGQGEKRT